MQSHAALGYIGAALRHCVLPTLGEHMHLLQQKRTKIQGLQSQGCTLAKPCILHARSCCRHVLMQPQMRRTDHLHYWEIALARIDKKQTRMKHHSTHAEHTPSTKEGIREQFL